jgi:signal transduction histidine kinase
VCDHGPGVPQRHLGKIFEPFYRGEDELTRRRKGTGLGLALVRGLVECMGATVAGRNVSKGGFEVEVVFPT